MQNEPTYKLTNLADDFLEFEERTRDLPLAKRLERIKAEAYDNDPYYDFVRGEWRKEGLEPDEKVREHLADFPELRDRFAQAAQRLPGQLDSAMTSFKKAFPDFDTGFDITLLHSLGRMDGGTRKIDGEMRFFFGADMIALYHDFGDDRPFFHHEFVHFYVEQLFKEGEVNWDASEALWRQLYSEGLAVYVSAALNPGASDKELLLVVPENLVQATRGNLSHITAEMLEHLESEDERLQDRYFRFGSDDPNFPKRCGYVVGYWIVEKMAEGRTLHELIRLDEQVILAEIRQHLDNVCLCVSVSLLNLSYVVPNRD